MTSSGTYNFQLSNADVVLEAFDRCEIRPAEITNEHLISARRSLNLELDSWSNLGINLWQVDLLQIPLIQGVATYNIDPTTVNILDTYLRTFQLPTTFTFTPNFSTVLGSNSVGVFIANHGLQVGYWIQIVTPISVGGLLLQGFYELASVINTNQFTILAASSATSTISSGGTLALFSTTATSSTVGVQLANHGLVVGQSFNIGASTMVGGLTLFGAYSVSGVTDVNNFGISVVEAAPLTATAYEAGGFCVINAQINNVTPTDRFMEPIARTDYAMISDKLVQAPPTCYWFDRTITPTITLWQVPDQNGPYVLNCYRMKRIQDAAPTMGQTADIPYRFYDTFCARMAARLAVKYAKSMLSVLQQLADKAWLEATTEDRERAEISILPSISMYWRN